MKSKIQKKEELKKLKAKFPEAKMTVFTTFSRLGGKGLSVAQMTQLKRLLKEVHSEYFVTKKTLIDLALREIKGLNSEANVYKIDGSIGLVFGQDDPYVVSKKIYEFAKKNQALQFFGALLNGQFVNLNEFLEMAKMPSREQLIARLLGMLTYPVRSLAVTLSEVAKKQSVKSS